MPSATLMNRIRSLSWVHRIDLGQGLVTPGTLSDNPIIPRNLDRVDFRGKKVLDIGCWDGLWSFEAEKRGAAEVYATDDVSQRPFPDQPTVELARQVLNSRIKYFPDVSVYDLPRLGVGDFDIVLFFGVYYHLKNPLLALARIRQVMRTGGLLLVEGEVINRRDACHAEFFYREAHAQDPSNWWVPTIPCLRNWIECSYFEIASEDNMMDDLFAGSRLAWLRRRLARYRGQLPKYSRCLIAARAVCRQDPGYAFPDADLRPFNCQVDNRQRTPRTESR